MTIHKVAILGAGAVGSYVIWGLSDVENLELGVIADGDRADKFKQNGCLINGKVFWPNVWTPKEAYGADLLIVALKYGSLPGALDSIAKVVGENTTVISLMNGIDSEDIIAEKIGMSHIVHALIKVASHKEGAGYSFNPETSIGIILGEVKPPFDSERICAIDKLFAASRLKYRITKNILPEMWSKFRLNVCNNLPQAIIGAGLGCYRDSEHMRAISEGLRRELEAIAQAKGIDLNVVEKSSVRGSAVPPTARFSTLQDLDAKRHTEIDMFSGAIVRMGKELGISTPYNEFTLHIIKALEEKNDGKFNYTDDDDLIAAS